MSFKSSNIQSQASRQDEILNLFKKKVELVQTSWAIFEKLGHEKSGQIIFQNLFALMPAIIQFFPFKNELNIYQSISFKNHAFQVSSQISICIKALNDPDSLKQILVGAFKILKSKGINPDRYHVVTVCFTNALRSLLKENLTTNLEIAWASILAYIQQTLTEISIKYQDEASISHSPIHQSSNRISKFSSISESVSVSHEGSSMVSHYASQNQKSESRNVIRRRKIQKKRFNTDQLQAEDCSMQDRIKSQIKKHFTPTEDKMNYENNGFSTMIPSDAIPPHLDQAQKLSQSSSQQKLLHIFMQQSKSYNISSHSSSMIDQHSSLEGFQQNNKQTLFQETQNQIGSFSASEVLSIIKNQIILVEKRQSQGAKKSESQSMYEVPQLMSLTCILNYDMVATKHQELLKKLKVPQVASFGLNKSQYWQFKSILILIVQNILEQSQIVANFQVLAQCYETKEEPQSHERYYMALKELSHLFKNLGATRPYYTVEKICETYLDHKIQKTFEQVLSTNEIWTFYPTLIEFTIQFLFFLDFELETMTGLNPQMHDEIQDESLFLKLVSDLKIADSFRVRQKGNLVYCLFRQNDFKQSASQRVLQQKCANITPNSVLNQAIQQMQQIQESQQLLQSSSLETQQQVEFLQSICKNLSVYQIQKFDEMNQSIKDFVHVPQTSSQQDSSLHKLSKKNSKKSSKSNSQQMNEAIQQPSTFSELIAVQQKKSMPIRNDYQQLMKLDMHPISEETYGKNYSNETPIAINNQSNDQLAKLDSADNIDANLGRKAISNTCVHEFPRVLGNLENSKITNRNNSAPTPIEEEKSRLPQIEEEKKEPQPSDLAEMASMPPHRLSSNFTSLLRNTPTYQTVSNQLNHDAQINQADVPGNELDNVEVFRPLNFQVNQQQQNQTQNFLKGKSEEDRQNLDLLEKLKKGQISEKKFMQLMNRGQGGNSQNLIARCLGQCQEQQFTQSGDEDQTGKCFIF